MKAYSFTAHPERGWSVVTPAGAIVVEPGQQVTVVVRERWESTVIPAREESARSGTNPTDRDGK